jgi:hypothetical protein
MTGATGTYTDEQLFQKMIFWSVAAHILLVLFFAVKTFLVPEESLPMEAAIRVDIIDLPDKVQTLPTQSKANEPKSVPKEDLKKAVICLEKALLEYPGRVLGNSQLTLNHK